MKQMYFGRAALGDVEATLCAGAAPACKLEWSPQLGRMILRRPDGSIWDVGFGDKANDAWFRASDLWRVTRASYGSAETDLP